MCCGGDCFRGGVPFGFPLLLDKIFVAVAAAVVAAIAVVGVDVPLLLPLAWPSSGPKSRSRAFAYRISRSFRSRSIFSLLNSFLVSPELSSSSLPLLPLKEAGVWTPGDEEDEVFRLRIFNSGLYKVF